MFGDDEEKEWQFFVVLVVPCFGEGWVLVGSLAL